VTDSDTSTPRGQAEREYAEALASGSVPIINHGYVPNAWDAPEYGVCKRCGAVWPTSEGCP